jgi:hypothetical protein
MDSQKVALLLHTGGADLQELYYTLVPENEEKGLKESFEVLDNYFVPKVNVPFERHLFRQMCQVAGETVDQFVCRLRQKALTCEFSDVDETIRDQLIEKCRNVKLRRKFLEKINASLKNFQDIARAHEAVEIQMRSLDQSDSQQSEDGQVNAVGQFGKKNQRGNKDGVHGNNTIGRYGRGTFGQKTGTDQRCFNCDHVGHSARDTICPTRDQRCNECGIRGHFSACCRKNNSKIPQGRNQEEDESRKKKVYQVDDEENPRTREDYAFVVGENRTGAGEITLMIGGVQLDGVLIDLVLHVIWLIMKRGVI